MEINKPNSSPEFYHLWPESWRRRYDKWGSIRPEGSDDHSELTQADSKKQK